MKLEVEAVIAESGQERADACRVIRRARGIVEAVRAATPAWKVWQSGPVQIALGVLRAIESVLCSET
jgi:hypothetical protein